MKTIILLLTFTLIHLFLNAQNETKNWCFGGGQHLLFDIGSVQVLSNCAISTPEAASSISDTIGNLLFYTNGESVWNKMNQVMQNGNGLNGNWSATQCLIVKQPLSNSLYYIFYAGACGDSAGANYAIVDISLNSGLGSVISKNNLLFSPSSEKFTAVKNLNGTDIWVMTRSMNPTVFKAYSLTSNGLNLTPVSSIDSIPENCGIGQMKFSHNGLMLALANSDSSRFELFDFNPNSGVLSNQRLSQYFPHPNVFGGGITYGIEFSPNDSILYGSLNFSSILLKYDLTTTGNPLLNYAVIGTSSGESLGALQLALDGNIYVGREEQFGLNSFLGVIHNPNSWNFANYSDNGLALSNYGNWSLPNFEQSLLRNVPPLITTSFNSVNSTLSFNAFPNPFNQEINVDATFKFSEITVTDLYGRVILNQHFKNANKFKTDLNELPKGMYIITIASEQKSQTKIVVKD